MNEVTRDGMKEKENKRKKRRGKECRNRGSKEGR